MIAIFATIVLQARRYIQSLPVMKKKDFKRVFEGANPLGNQFHYDYKRPVLKCSTSWFVIESVTECRLTSDNIFHVVHLFKNSNTILLILSFMVVKLYSLQVIFVSKR